MFGSHWLRLQDIKEIYRRMQHSFLVGLNELNGRSDGRRRVLLPQEERIQGSFDMFFQSLLQWSKCRAEQSHNFDYIVLFTDKFNLHS